LNHFVSTSDQDKNMSIGVTVPRLSAKDVEPARRAGEAADMTPHQISTIAPGPGSDWTELELFQLRQLERLCAADSRLACEFGRTDEHDPWCIFQAGEELFCCIARVDRRYILTFPSLNRTDAWATIDPLIEAAHTALRGFVETMAGERNRAGADRWAAVDGACSSSQGAQSTPTYPLEMGTMGNQKTGQR